MVLKMMSAIIVSFIMLIIDRLIDIIKNKTNVYITLDQTKVQKDI
jgi:hypothetical protein